MLFPLANRCIPVPVVVYAVSDSSDAQNGSVVHLVCITGFTYTNDESVQTLQCNGGNWNISEQKCSGKSLVDL